MKIDVKDLIEHLSKKFLHLTYHIFHVLDQRRVNKQEQWVYQTN